MNRRAKSPITGPIEIFLPEMHQGQLDAFFALRGQRFKALRCGRRFGKTQTGIITIAERLLRGQECGWFAPNHMTWSETYSEIADLLHPVIDMKSKQGAVIRMITGGRLDFWTLENPIAARGRRYHFIVIDEAAFAKDGDNKTDGSMMSIWDKAIKPTLLDYNGEALALSNSAGKNPDNWFYNICTDPAHGFAEFHATTFDNPTIPKRLPDESFKDWQARRARILNELKGEHDPLVFAQEYMAEFVDWAGVAFFDRAKLLFNNRPVASPTICDAVFAVIDTAVKTGTEHDGTAVTFFAVDKHVGPFPLLILDWDIVQIEGALLETWLPKVYERLQELADVCRARLGSIGVFIEDKNSGTVLLQQAARRGWLATPIDSKLTAMGKDERAISVSGYVFQAKVKFTEHAFNKVTTYKRKLRNHLLEQIESFRVGDKDNKREDDLLDSFVYGISLALGDRGGF